MRISTSAAALALAVGGSLALAVRRGAAGKA